MQSQKFTESHSLMIEFTAVCISLLQQGTGEYEKFRPLCDLVSLLKKHKATFASLVLSLL